MKRRDVRKRTESKPVRLQLPTVDLLDQLRQARVALPYSGYDQLIRELAWRELERRRVGKPTPHNLPAAASAAANPGAPLPVHRNGAHDGNARHSDRL